MHTLQHFFAACKLMREDGGESSVLRVPSMAHVGFHCTRWSCACTNGLHSIPTITHNYFHAAQQTVALSKY
jgi:hypothetical protein